MYDYKDGYERIKKILGSKTKIINDPNIPDNDLLEFNNAYRTWVASVFIDIRDSTSLFINNDESVARLMRAFISEGVRITKSLDLYKDIGIRGDMVYAIYDVKTRVDLINVFKVAITLNTFMKMFNKVIKEFGYDEIKAGIGASASSSLIAKAGINDISDNIWIGRAIVEAANLANLANKDSRQPICISSSLYKAIIGDLTFKNKEFKYYFIHDEDDIYECNLFLNEYLSFTNEV